MKVYRAERPVEARAIDEYLENVQVSQELFWFVRKEPVDRCVRRGDRQALYVEQNGEIAGVCLVWSDSRILAPSEACVRNIVVSSRLRGEGYGHRLLGEAEQFAEDEGKETMVADVVAESPHQTWWKRQGYEERDRRFTKSGREMVVYEKELEPTFATEDPLEF